MNATTFAASCAALCALPFLHVASSPAAAGAGTEETTVVIRYDPEAVFLTHELVAPLCNDEVELTDDSAEGPVGELVMERMDSNKLQPKGVFVGRVSLVWNSADKLSAERREALLESGLEQLRAALSSRLVEPRRDELRRRVMVLEAMEGELMEAADVKAQELARRDELLSVTLELDEATATIRARRLERSAAQQEMMIAMNMVREFESKLETARTKVELVRSDVERLQTLVEKGVSSELDLGAAEQKLRAATNELDVASTHVENQHMMVEQRQRQVEAAEEMLALLEARIAELETRVAALSAEETSGTAATLELAHATDHGRLSEIGAELQRARAALATVTEVTVERW